MANHLAWPRLINARDLGGIPAGDGHRVRAGALVRSESPHPLDLDGWREVADHGVRTVVDLRSEFERQAAPHGGAPRDHGIEVVVPGLEDGLLADEEFRGWAESGLLSCALYYPRFLERWPDRVAAAVRSVACARPGGVLVHCVGGRDRTGLVVALVLAAVGVRSEDIVVDYLLTDERYALAGEWFGEGRMEVEAALYADHGTSAPAFVADLLDSSDVDAYLRGAGLEPAELAALRTRLVDPIVS